MTPDQRKRPSNAPTPRRARASNQWAAQRLMAVMCFALGSALAAFSTPAALADDPVGQATETVEETADTVSETAGEAVETVEGTAATVGETPDSVVETVEQTADSAVDQANNAVGDLLGGEDATDPGPGGSGSLRPDEPVTSDGSGSGGSGGGSGSDEESTPGAGSPAPAGDPGLALLRDPPIGSPAGAGIPVLDRPSGAAGQIMDAAIEAAKRLAFPLVLVFTAMAFVAIQNRLDRKDPRLALAPACLDVLTFA